MYLVVIMPVLLSNTAGMISVVSMTVSCILSMSYTSKDTVSASNTYTNWNTLPLSQLEQGGSLAPLKFQYYIL